MQKANTTHSHTHASLHNLTYQVKPRHDHLIACHIGATHDLVHSPHLWHNFLHTPCPPEKCKPHSMYQQPCKHTCWYHGLDGGSYLSMQALRGHVRCARGSGLPLGRSGCLCQRTLPFYIQVGALDSAGTNAHTINSWFDMVQRMLCEPMT